MRLQLDIGRHSGGLTRHLPSCGLRTPRGLGLSWFGLPHGMASAGQENSYAAA